MTIAVVASVLGVVVSVGAVLYLSWREGHRARSSFRRRGERAVGTEGLYGADER